MSEYEIPMIVESCWITKSLIKSLIQDKIIKSNHRSRGKNIAVWSSLSTVSKGRSGWAMVKICIIWNPRMDGLGHLGRWFSLPKQRHQSVLMNHYPYTLIRWISIHWLSWHLSPLINVYWFSRHEKDIFFPPNQETKMVINPEGYHSPFFEAKQVETPEFSVTGPVQLGVPKGVPWGPQRGRLCQGRSHGHLPVGGWALLALSATLSGRWPRWIGEMRIRF